MSKSRAAKITALLLSAFYLFGAYSNAFPSETVAASYVRWGYPSWFHMVTAALELAVAALLVSSGTRFLGAMLGTVVMAAALGTLVLHGLAAHGLPALVVLGLSALVAAASMPSRATVSRFTKLPKSSPTAGSTQA